MVIELDTSDLRGSEGQGDRGGDVEQAANLLADSIRGVEAIRGLVLGLDRTIAYTEAHLHRDSPMRGEADEVLAVWRSLRDLVLTVEAECPQLMAPESAS